MTGSRPEPDWDRAGVEVAEHLRALIRLDTTNPPGNEILAGRYLADIFAGANIPVQLLEPSPGRATVVARLRATVKNPAPPVLLLAHSDVVGVADQPWTVNPFGGVVQEGYLYGRGAIDDKGMLAVHLMTMLLLQDQIVGGGARLSRDVVFVATADEEANGEWGIGWLLAAHPELVDAAFALNEGGRLRVVDGKPLYAAIQTAEKITNTVRVTARGPGGHASVPLAENAILRLGRALAAVGAHRETMRLTPTTRRFFAALATVWPDERVGRAMRDIATREPARVRRAERVLAEIPMLDAVLRNGISPTVLDGGIRHNVIPPEASVLLNVRTIPGQSLDAVVQRLRRAIDDPEVTITVEARGQPAPASALDSPMFHALADAINALDPEIVVMPYLSTGATDSAHLRAHGVQAYGLLPFPLPQEDEARMHAADERVSLEGLAFGLRVVYGAIARVTA